MGGTIELLRAVLHNEAGGQFFDGPGRREAAARRLGQRQLVLELKQVGGDDCCCCGLVMVVKASEVAPTAASRAGMANSKIILSIGP